MQTIQTGEYTATTNPLTPREAEAVGWLSQGKTLSMTAQIMGISEKTARTHRDNAKEKLNACNIAHLVSRCWQQGIIRVLHLCLCLIVFGGTVAQSANVQADDNPINRQHRQRSGGRRITRRHRANTRLDSNSLFTLDEENGGILLDTPEQAIELDDHPYLPGYVPTRLALPEPEWLTKHNRQKKALIAYLEGITAALQAKSEILQRSRNQLIASLHLHHLNSHTTH